MRIYISVDRKDVSNDVVTYSLYTNPRRAFKILFIFAQYSVLTIIVLSLWKYTAKRTKFRSLRCSKIEIPEVVKLERLTFGRVAHKIDRNIQFSSLTLKQEANLMALKFATRFHKFPSYEITFLSFYMMYLRLVPALSSIIRKQILKIIEWMIAGSSFTLNE